MVVALETDSDLLQVSNGGGGVWNLPAHHGAKCGRKLLAHSKPQHDTVGVEHQRERRLFAEQPQPKRVAVEFLRTRDVDDGEEAYDIVFAETGLRHALIMRH